MSDATTGRSLGRSLKRRAQRVDARPNLEVLMGRLDRRMTRQRNVLLAGIAAFLVIGGVVGYAVGSASSPESARIVALNDGVPDPTSDTPAIEPDNVPEAVAAIDEAFHEAFEGGTPVTVRWAAVQSGSRLESLRQDALAAAQRFGITPAELAGSTIEVRDTSFVDRTHAVVHFTITIPGRGPVLVDQVGYAVVDAGRWKVSLRTACDLLSLSGLGRACPPPGR
ncbi:MAG TPA: hypothetical protein VIH82_01555 [Acidimicrobiia bacterium]